MSDELTERARVAGARASMPTGPVMPQPLGDSDVVANFATSLARAARSFVMYDAKNDAVAALIRGYREAALLLRQRIGAVVLDIRPFEMTWNGEVIYREPDRERSMAFRIYRDGIRQLVLTDSPSWEDLLKLLEVLSIRYKGIRQQEDDTLTLLRQAELTTIDFVAVETYVPSEQDPEEGVGTGYEAPQRAPESSWDLPIPSFAQQGTLAYRPVSDEQRKAVLQQHSPAAQARAAIQVVDEVLRIANGDVEHESAALTLTREVCKYLVVELRPAELARAVRAARAILGERPEVVQLERDFGSADVLERFLSNPNEVSADALAPLFSLVADDHLERIVDRFIAEPDARFRQALMQILTRVAVGQPEVLLRKLGEVPTERMVDLFNVVAVVAPPARCIEAAYAMTEHESPDVQLGALGVLAMDSDKDRLMAVLVGLLEGPTTRVRVEAARILGQTCGPRAYRPLASRLEELARAGQLEQVEATTFGKAMIVAAHDQAARAMREWLRPRGLKGIVRKVRYRGDGERMLRWAAVTGLSRDHTEASRDALTWVAEKGDEKLAELAKQVLQTFPTPEQLAEAARLEEEAAEARRRKASRGMRRGSARRVDPK